MFLSHFRKYRALKSGMGKSKHKKGYTNPSRVRKGLKVLVAAIASHNLQKEKVLFF